MKNMTKFKNIVTAFTQLAFVIELIYICVCAFSDTINFNTITVYPIAYLIFIWVIMEGIAGNQQPNK
jgi:hypothetical protein